MHLLLQGAASVSVCGLLTCLHCLPAQGEGAASLKVVGRDGAVVVSCWTPRESGRAFRDLLHYDHSRRPRGTYRQDSG